MDRCPAEVWTHIFGLACTDGGVTGCSLSEVSRYFREAVLPVQLDSVALTGGHKMARFASLLHQRESTHRHVRHLYLSRGNSPSRQNNTHVYRILTTVAPDLLTLTSTLSQRRISKESVLCIPFPLLLELSVHGHFTNPDESDEAKMQERLPSLRYLHVLSSCNNATVYTSRAPMLTHLRLSEMFGVDVSLAESLQGCLSGTTSHNQPSPFSPTIQKIILQHSGPIARLKAGVGIAGNAFHLDSSLRTLLDADKDSKFTLLKDDRALEYRRNSRKDWEDRITGGLGCWSEDGKDDQFTRARMKYIGF
ncbi:hypothetical protein NM688_g4111 [Phlebia brevispora]|uniref:Uncharacterized protein n=1 Tax=Phlebia brevispora TaxID=194682 RepID=A0ACC1T3X9_9APHY|nr:hypothetical protein NM688_g4111 [Phlebia brevispora]